MFCKPQRRKNVITWPEFFNRGLKPTVPETSRKKALVHGLLRRIVSPPDKWFQRGVFDGKLFKILNVRNAQSSTLERQNASYTNALAKIVVPESPSAHRAHSCVYTFKPIWPPLSSVEVQESFKSSLFQSAVWSVPQAQSWMDRSGGEPLPDLCRFLVHLYRFLVHRWISRLWQNLTAWNSQKPIAN